MKKHNCSVSAILYNKDNQILFVSPNGHDRWQTVIGGLEDEDVEEGILREIKGKLRLFDVLIIDVLDVHTFRYRDVENILSIWFLVKYKSGKIIPSDDITGYTYKWFGENEIDDLDGTFLKSDKSISPHSFNTIKEIYKKEDIVLFASARPPRSIHYVKNAFHHTPFIFYNGVMYSLIDGTNVYISIKSKVVKEIAAFIKKMDKDAVISIEVNDHWYANDSAYDFAKHYHVHENPDIISIHELTKYDCAKILVNNCKIADKIKDTFNDSCTILVTDNNALIQIMNKNASKGNAVNRIVESLGASMKQVICFGDDHNDIGLFKNSGICVAMENAINELKLIASYVTETNDNDGISIFVEKFYHIIKTF